MEMTLKIALGIALKVTIAVLMVSLGLQATHDDLLQLWRRPKLLAGCVVAAFVVVPAAAYLVFQILPLSLEARVGLWVVAITPGAPMIYRAASRGISIPGLAASFQVTMALLVIVFAPIWLAIVGALSGSHYWIPPLVVAEHVSKVELIPILLGLAIHRRWPAFAQRAAKVLVATGGILFALLVVILLVVFGSRLVAKAEGWNIAAAALIEIAAISSGHLLTGPDLASRMTIGKANGQRNAGLALAIAAWNLPAQKGPTIIMVITYILVATVIATIYTAICERRARRAAREAVRPDAGSV